MGQLLTRIIDHKSRILTSMTRTLQMSGVMIKMQLLLQLKDFTSKQQQWMSSAKLKI